MKILPIRNPTSGISNTAWSPPNFSSAMICSTLKPTRFADVILPAAAWSENDGTFANSERRVSRVRTASEPPGISKPNWWIFKELAKRVGARMGLQQCAGDLGQRDLGAGAALVGIKYSRIENDGLQWPCAYPGPSGDADPAQRRQFHPRQGAVHSCGLDAAGGSPR